MWSSKLRLAGRLLLRGGCVRRQSRAGASSLVLGIESSCDDTGAAVLDLEGRILGEALHSQKEVHLKNGGIIPMVAQQLHREHIDRVVSEALALSGVSPQQLSAVATTIKPGLGPSLEVGLEFSRRFVAEHRKPFIPIHHMEAHALTVRMTEQVDFPFLVLLISGGHALIAVARGVDDFLLLGHSLDEAPGEAMDKLARCLSLSHHPLCSSLSGGQALELLARTGNHTKFILTTPMLQHPDCNFSFTGIRAQASRAIKKKEEEEGVEPGSLLSCVNDIAASVQHTVARHLAQRTHRAILFCRSNRLLPENATLVVSGGVASNQYIRKALGLITEKEGLRLLCPPPKLCTDNGVMIAWNGVERFRENKGVLSPDVKVRYVTKAPLGTDLTAEVRAAAIKVPRVRKRIT